MPDDTNQDETDGVLTRRGVFGATLAATTGLGLASMTGSAAAQNNMVMRNAYIGDSANRTSGIGGRGWLYFETDTGDIYFDDGSGWTKLDVGGGVGGSTPDPQIIDSTQTSYSTDGSSVVYVDTSGSGTGEAITLTISSSNEVNGAELEIYDVGAAAGSNPIAVVDSDGNAVTEIATNRRVAELRYQKPTWLRKEVVSGNIYWRLQESEITIPDSAVAQYSAKEYNGDNTNIIDNVGSNDLSETGSGTYTYVQDGINGYPAWQPGSELNYQAGVSLSISQPFTIFAVTDLTTNTNRFSIVNTGSNDTFRLQPGKTRTVLNAGSYYTGSPDPTTNPAVYTVVFDGSNTLIRENGTQYSVGDIGNDGISQIELFYAACDAGLLGLVELHNGYPSNGLQTREQEIANQWDITV